MASLAWTTITGGAASLNHHYSGTRRTKTFSKPPPSPETLAAIQAIQCVRHSPISTTESPRFRSDEPRKGADVLIETLEHEGVTDVFAYPGGASVEIHQALTRSATIRNHLLRHEQGEIFAAEGYARSTGRPGVCIATSGPGATNLVSGLADALLDSVPLVAITGQVPRRMIGTDAFQETPIVEVTRSISKHNYLVLDVDDIPRVVREAFFLSTSGRPGPVLVDIPKDIQQQLVVPCWNSPLRFHGYISRLPKPPKRHFIEQLLRLLSGSSRPVIYAGGGCSNAASALRRFADLAGIPVASTLMGLGIFPTDDDLSLKMLGMPVVGCDLLLAFGMQFDKLEAFANRAKIVHVDIDPAGIGKNKSPHLSVCADVRQSLEALNNAILETGLDKKFNFSAWREELDQARSAHPLSYKVESTEAIPPQHAIELLDELTSGEAIISTGDGHHQMWAAQYYTYRRPRQWLSSAGFGAMGFGLPAAAGAAVGNPGVTVVDIDGDWSFLMNVQELAMIRIENLPVKIMVLNNQQHLGMDAFYNYQGDGHSNETEVYPDLVAIAKGFNVPGARVTKRSLLRGAMREMLDTPGPYLLDVIVPSGAAFKDLTTE